MASELKLDIGAGNVPVTTENEREGNEDYQ